MSDDKTEKFSVSMPANVLAAIDAQVDATPSETRSGWLTAVVVKELTALGALGANSRAELFAKVTAAIEADPTMEARIEKVIAKATRTVRAA